VPQVYLSFPSSAGEPPKRLVAFEKVWLEPGQSKVVRLSIDPRSSSHPLGVWDGAAQRWTTVDGAHAIMVGTSSAGTMLTDTLTVRAARR
jgi:beta-glucosidase